MIRHLDHYQTSLWQVNKNNNKEEPKQLLRPALKQLQLTCQLGFCFSLIFAGFVNKAFALSISPLILDSSSGSIKVRNTTDRFKKVKVVPYLTKFENNETTIDLTSEAEASKHLRITPSTLRISGKSFRRANYNIIDRGKNIYLCAEGTGSSQFYLRVCSLWRAARTRTKGPAQLKSEQ